MNRFLKKCSVIAAAVAMTATLAIPAFGATTYTPVAGTSCNFNKFLIMDAGDTVPNATFAFTIAPGNPRSADTSSNAVMQVLAGVGTPTIANVTFSPSDTTATAAGTNIDVARTAASRASGLTPATGVELESGEKYATKQATVDFSSVTFDEPGIYRYIITETANTDHAAAGIMHDNDVDRVLDVYVTDDGTGTLAVSSYVLHLNDEDVPISTTSGSDVVTPLPDKTDGFTNEVNSKDLVFAKEVAGNQASRDKWFEFTVTVGNINDNDSYVVSIADDNDANTTDGLADATTGTTSATRASNQSKTNPQTVTGAQLKAGQKFYLQHGQRIAIRGLAPNATYLVVEDAEDYTSAAAAVTGYTNPTQGTIGTVAATNKAVMTSYKNTRQGVVPTGIALAIGAGVGVAAVGVGGFAFMSRKKKHDEDDED